MFIKTQDGAICNLALATDIVHNVSPSRVSSRVLAIFNGDENMTCIFSGTHEQCGKYIDFLWSQLQLANVTLATLPLKED